ncbi:MAG: hypothetical protein IT171_09435 [Acidobacteria bacterium]|nr:hypothetical protein [Acidobacteriota bacterium]
MSTTLEKIKPDTLARIEKHAQFLGLSVDEYLQRLLPIEERELALKPEFPDDEFEQDMAQFADVTELNDRKGSYSREDIYFDHD